MLVRSKLKNQIFNQPNLEEENCKKEKTINKKHEKNNSS
jgi:hypothetical protein